MKVLIIDDDIELCNSLKLLLEHEGFDVELTHNGYDGQERIFENKYDAIIMDMMIPILNGNQVLKTIKSKGIMTPIIIMSAAEEYTVRNQDYLDDIDKCIKKPFVFETLLDILRNTQLSPAPNRGLIIYDDITLTPNDRMLCSKNRKCTLSKWETQLLELFLSSPGVPLSYNALCAVWNANYHTAHKELELYIGLLKRRLRNIESNLIIKEVWGTGYCIEPSVFT